MNSFTDALTVVRTECGDLHLGLFVSCHIVMMHLPFIMLTAT